MTELLQMPAKQVCEVLVWLAGAGIGSS